MAGTLKLFVIVCLITASPCPLIFAKQLQEPIVEQFTTFESAIEHAQKKLLDTLEELSYNSSYHPGHTDRLTDRWDPEYLKRSEWTSGFFSGSLWYMYKLTGDTKWRTYATAWTEDLESASSISYDHDTGFRIFSSFGNAYKLVEGRYYYRVILNSAETLSRRFNPEIGAIKSWDWIGNFPVIIDNLMNLELLFWTAEQTGNRKLYDIAYSHAKTSLQHHLRPDGSTYHIVDFDNTGNINWKDTRQGFNSQSVWARGQAWGIYGFTMIYRFTQEKRFLEAAISASDYFIQNLPEDYIPIYDFMEPYGSVRTKDTSAAAIAASAFFELYTITNNSHYYNTAVRILESLSSDKYSTVNSRKNSILKESTLHRGLGNVGTSYADYYYLEAIIRYLELNKTVFPQLSGMPALFLDQNYPNPFNNSTVIHYSIEEPGNAEISVYDLMGRKIASLMNQHHNIGNYKVTFDGSGLASGSYVYVLRTSEKMITRKMVYLK
jgi:unsaturated chondroitin disaccharide hydrolase